MTFEPKIIGFLCNWCSYAGADLAGVSRLQYPPNIRIHRVMCSGRIDINFILEAFLDGTDGVLISGCHPGDCHYIRGNLTAKKRIEFAKKIIENIGIEPGRLKLTWVSASEGARWQQVVTDFTNQIKALGPSPFRGKKFSGVRFRELGRELPEKRKKLLEAIIKLAGIGEEVKVEEVKLPVEEINSRLENMLKNLDKVDKELKKIEKKTKAEEAKVIAGIPSERVGNAINAIEKEISNLVF